MVIETNELGYKAGSKFIIKNINWTVQPQEHWLVFGLNGCGKTTLLSMIAGYKSNSHGQLKLFGQELNDYNRLEIRRRIGFVSSSFLDNYYSREVALDIVLSGKFGALGLQDNIGDKDVIKALTLLDELGIRNKAGFPYDLLSKGQRQKVLIARGLIVEPELLILDEPCAGMDFLSRQYILNTISYLAAKRAVTIIFVTHYAEEILPVFHRGLLLKDGQIHSQGALTDVFNQDNMTDFFNCPAKVTWHDQRVNISIDYKPDSSQAFCS